MNETQEISSTTQKFLDIFDITSNVVVLRNGTVSLVLSVSAMNFGLLAEQEQDSIIYAYAALLNSLNFPIQIIVSSKTKDATAYLQLLEDQAQKADVDKRNRIKRYQNFVGQLIKERNVLDKKFYVSIPAAPLELGVLTAQSLLPGQPEPEITEEQEAAIIEKALGILEPRRDHLVAQFNRIGLYARQLNTQEIIEVFYNSYNPEAYEGQQITDSRNYATAVVKAGTSSAPSLKEMQEQLKTKEQLEKIASTPENPLRESLENTEENQTQSLQPPTPGNLPQPATAPNQELTPPATHGEISTSNSAGLPKNPVLKQALSTNNPSQKPVNDEIPLPPVAEL